MITPVRRIRPTKGMNYRSKIGSTKNLQIIYAESLLERDYVRLCNFDPSVLKIYYQPRGIEYHYKGKKRTYYPDYLIISSELKYYLVEVKLKEFVNKNTNKAKFVVAKEYCKLKNWTFLVLTEDQIRPGFLQKNLRILLEKTKYENNPSVVEYIKVVLLQSDFLTIGELRELCNVIEPSVFMINLYKMIYNGEVGFDLFSQTLNDEGIIWLNP
ncbi:TnsA endonuclease N-terminal domain-containing protein [Paenibacillus sp. FSL H7-0714]|uniref:TnsA endonuclease N-terminal domain-containing protein n=1 Tax=Paenibacillus sp. FSL H7-0714 TaxID=2954735 RepID=UPI0030FAB0FD